MAAAGLQFFHRVDLADPKALFAVRLNSKPLLLQSHGWLDGTLRSGTLEEAAQGFKLEDQSTWPEVTPHQDLVFVDRYGRRAPLGSVRVPLDRVRAPSQEPPLLSAVFVRWGGKHRIGEDTSDDMLATDGGWGKFGCPPCDWYIDEFVNTGVKNHAALIQEAGSYPNAEVMHLFVGSDDDMNNLATKASDFVAGLRGSRRATFFMLWPSDWRTDWCSEGYEAYVERRLLFAAMTGMEDTGGLKTSFPHPSACYEFVTSKAWMATLCHEPKARLPAAVLVGRKEITQDPVKQAKLAMEAIKSLRQTSCFAAQGGPSVVNRKGLTKGVVKLGFSWEAKHVWFWNGLQELTSCMQGLIQLDSCLAERCVIQEWVDFDFELRLFFFPPADWASSREVLKPLHYQYTSWRTAKSAWSPGSFTKPQRAECLARWENDEQALDSGHAQAEEASQFLIGHLLTISPEPVPMIRMDFMLKRTGPGECQVAFGEFCENGACSLQWDQGPPTVWRASLDYALR